MRKKTEYGAQPDPFEIVENGTAATVILRENIAQLDSGADGSERWEADEYRFSGTNSAALAERIEENFGAWLAMARQRDRDACAATVRAERNKLIAGLDFMFISDYPATESEKAAMGEYRQALRDITEQDGFPYDIEWPARPA